MVNVREFVRLYFVRPYKEAGALHCLFAPHRFLDDRVFLTKGIQLGVTLTVEGIGAECLAAATLETYTRRVAAAWRSFDDRFRLYQYVIKQDRVPLGQSENYANPVVEETVRRRSEFLAAKPQGLCSVRLFYVVLLEPGAFHRKHGLSSKHAIESLGAGLHRQRATLIGHVESLQRTWATCWAFASCRKPTHFSSCVCSAISIRTSLWPNS